MPRSRRGALALVALLAALPSIPLYASVHGRMLAAGDFLNLWTIALPAASILFLVSALRLVTSPEDRWHTLLYGLIAASGVTLAFQGVRVLSTFWLLWNRGLILADPGFLIAAGGALLWLAAGLLALVETSRVLGTARSGRGLVVAAGLGVISVPLLPWILLKGQGTAPLLFNDVVDAAYSAFPAQPAIAVHLWTITGALLALVVACFVLAPWVRSSRRVRLALAVLGGAVVAWGYRGFLVEASAMDATFQAGQVQPLFNYLPVLAVLVGLWQASRTHVLAERVKEPGEEHATARGMGEAA